MAKNVYDMVLPALQGKGLPTHFNDTHIVLIPKTDNPQHASQIQVPSSCAM